MSNRAIAIVFVLLMGCMFAAAHTPKSNPDLELAKHDARCKGQCGEAKAFSHHSWVGIDNVE